MVFRLLFEQEAEKAVAAKTAEKATEKAAAKPASGDAVASTDAAECDTTPANKSPASE